MSASIGPPAFSATMMETHRKVLERDVPPFRQILIVQACAVVVTILAGVIAGLIAASWIWAIATAAAIYALSQAAVMAWAAWWMITRRRRLELRAERRPAA